MKRPNAPRGVSKIKPLGYANGGRVNMLRSAAEREVDKQYMPKPPAPKPFARPASLEPPDYLPPTHEFIPGMGVRVKK